MLGPDYRCGPYPKVYGWRRCTRCHLRWDDTAPGAHIYGPHTPVSKHGVAAPIPWLCLGWGLPGVGTMPPRHRTYEPESTPMPTLTLTPTPPPPPDSPAALARQLAELQRQVDDVAARVRVAVAAERFATLDREVRDGDYALVDGHATRVTLGNYGTMTIANGGFYEAGYPPASLERLYTVAEVEAIVARATHEAAHINIGEPDYDGDVTVEFMLANRRVFFIVPNPTAVADAPAGAPTVGWGIASRPVSPDDGSAEARTAVELATALVKGLRP